MDRNEEKCSEQTDVFCFPNSRCEKRHSCWLSVKHTVGVFNREMKTHHQDENLMKTVCDSGWNGEKSQWKTMLCRQRHSGQQLWEYWLYVCPCVWKTHTHTQIRFLSCPQQDQSVNVHTAQCVIHVPTHVVKTQGSDGGCSPLLTKHHSCLNG